MPREAIQGYTKEEAEEALMDCRELGGVAFMIPQADGRWTVVYDWPDKKSRVVDLDDAGPAFAEPQPGGERGAGMTGDPEPLSVGGGRLPAAPPSSEDLLGRLSAKYESRGGPGTIGRDSTGGFSYGTYQIATRTGTMRLFLRFLEGAYPVFAQELNGAGGADGAMAGSAAFRGAWKRLAEDPLFARSQHDFIRATHYDPFSARLKGLGLDLEARSAALRDVAWSVAVQHGPGSDVFMNALAGGSPERMTDRDIIVAVYRERSRVEKYFSRSTPGEREAVRSRFERECSDALAMLA